MLLLLEGLQDFLSLVSCIAEGFLARLLTVAEKVVLALGALPLDWDQADVRSLVSPITERLVWGL